MIRAIRFIRQNIPRVRSAVRNLPGYNSVLNKANALWSKLPSQLKTAFYIIDSIMARYTRYGMLESDLKEIKSLLEKAIDKFLGFRLEIDAKGSDQYLIALKQARDLQRPREMN